MLLKALALSASFALGTLGGCTQVGESLFNIADAKGGDSSSDGDTGGGEGCVTFAQVTAIMTEAGCTGCHGVSGNLSVATVQDMLDGGNGGPAIIKNDPDNSLLICRMEDSSCGSMMPLGGTPVSADKIALLRRWISEGMEDPAVCDAAAGPTFADISPIFQEKCIGCHVGAALGGLDLSTEAGLQAGGNSGPAFVECDSATSLIIHRLDGTQPSLMPQGGPALADEDIDRIAAYIDGAAACGGGETCADGIQNQGEEGVDCGGPCTAACNCSDGIRNADEVGVDCGGSCAACPAGSIDYDTQIAPIFAEKGCAEAGSCHGQAAADAPRGFNFTIDSMVALPGTLDAPQDAPLVLACDADNSLLYKVLVSATAAPDPAIIRMPQTGNFLDASELQLVKDWIDQGASPVIDPSLCP